MPPYSNLSQMNFEVSKEQRSFLDRVDAACRSIRQYEEKCYLEEKFNDRIVPVFGKIGMLGCPISKKYGGLGLQLKGLAKKAVLSGLSFQHIPR